MDASQPAIETALQAKHILDEVLAHLPDIDIQTDSVPINLSDSVSF